MRGQSTPSTAVTRRPTRSVRRLRAVVSTSGSSGNGYGDRSLLTFRAVVRATPADPFLLDDRVTPRTRRPRSTVAVRKFAIGDGLAMRHERGALAHRVVQHGADGAVQARDLRVGERIGWAPRMEFRSPQRFVGVDVADAADDRLVHDPGLERNPASSQPDTQVSRGESPRERFDANLLSLDEPLDFGLR